MMKKLFVILMAMVLGPNCFSQSISETQIFEGGLMIERQIHNSKGKVKRVEKLDKDGNIKLLTIITDTATINTYFRDDNIEGKLIYRIDGLGNNTDIIKLNDKDSIISQMSFLNQYQDTLLMESTCISGCEYYMTYQYDENNRLIKSDRINISNKEPYWTFKWKYNSNNQVIEYVIDNHTNVGRSDQKFKSTYEGDNLKIEDNYVRRDGAWILSEKTIFDYKENLLINKRLTVFDEDTEYNSKWTYSYKMNK